MLSSDHAMILVQRGQFYIQDLSSVNGTMLDGRPLRPESSEPLPSPAEIKAGDTTFTFVKFDVSPSTSVPETREEPREGSRRPTTLR
jgi:pSer/pThr/pTyr-binding forkhead associated (FHA) protein